MIFPDIETIHFERYKTDSTNTRRAFVGYSDIDKWNNDPKLVSDQYKYLKFDEIPADKNNFALLYQNADDDDLYLQLFLSAVNEGSISTSTDEVDDPGIRNFTKSNVEIIKAAGITNTTLNTYEHNRWLINCCGDSIGTPNILQIISYDNSLQYDFSYGFTTIAWRELRETASQPYISGILTNEKYNDTVQLSSQIASTRYIFYAITTIKSNSSLKYYDKLRIYTLNETPTNSTIQEKYINESNKNNVNLYSEAYEYSIYVNVELPGYESNIDDYYRNTSEIKAIPTNFTKTNNNTTYTLSVEYIDSDISEDMQTEFEINIFASKNSQQIFISNVPIYEYTINADDTITVDKTKPKYKLDRTKWNAKLKIDNTNVIDIDNSNIQLYANFTATNILSVGMHTIVNEDNTQNTDIAESYNLKLGYLKIYNKAFSDEKIKQIYRKEAITDFHDFIKEFVIENRVSLYYYNSSTNQFTQFKSITGDTAQYELTKNKWINGDYGINVGDAKSIVYLTQYNLDDIAVDDFYKNNFIGWSNDINNLTTIADTGEGNQQESYYAVSPVKVYYHLDKSSTASYIEETYNNGAISIKPVTNSQFNFVRHTETGEDGNTKTYNVIGWTSSSTIGNHTEYNLNTKYVTNHLHLYPIYKRDAYTYTTTTPPVYETWYKIQAEYSGQNLINIFNGKSLSDTVAVYLKHNGNTVNSSSLVHPDTGHPKQYEPPSSYESQYGSGWSSSTANGYSANRISVDDFQKKISDGETVTHNVAAAYK